MLPTNVFIDNVASVGGGQYTLDLYFLQTSKGKFLALGDFVRDTQNTEFEIVAIANDPHTDGGQVTVQFTTTAIAPVADVDYDSTAFTPGQKDIRPEGKTAIIVNNVQVYDARNYEYTVNIDVDSTAEADKVVVGDSLVDFNGKDFELTFIDPTNRFNVACRVKEVHKEGVLPTLGDGSIYEPTDNIGLFQGTPISDPSRTVTRNRDNWIIDAKIKELEEAVAGGTSSGALVEDTYTNETGATLNALVAVATDASGNLKKLDISQEIETKAFKGITAEAISDASSGRVAKLGILENISTVFAHQDALYVAKDGTLTNVPPEIGSNGFLAGDFVIYVGHISRNETNSSQKDLELKPQIIGQL